MRSPKEPANEYGLTLRQADQAWTDFAAITDDLEFIMGRLAKASGRVLDYKPTTVGEDA